MIFVTSHNSFLLVVAYLEDRIIQKGEIMIQVTAIMENKASE